MNNQGQIRFFFFLMLGIVVLLLALAFAPGIKQSVELSMNSENLDCNNAAISNFDKTTCIAVDLFTFQYIGGLIFIGLSILTGAIVLKIRSDNE